MADRLTYIRFLHFPAENINEIRFDWSNSRHQAIRFNGEPTPEKIVEALLDSAFLIKKEVKGRELETDKKEI